MVARHPAWHHRRVRRLALVLAALVVLAACGDDGDEDVAAGPPPAEEAPSPPDRPAEITGPVAGLQPATESTSDEPCPPTGSADEAVSSDDEQCPTGAAAAGRGSLRIDEGTGTYTAAIARVDDGTTVLRRLDDAYEPASFADVQVGDRVEVWFEGAVGESSPVQGRAAAVVLEV
jgi:hypothetical protein